jgi:hypothetical protein
MIPTIPYIHHDTNYPIRAPLPTGDQTTIGIEVPLGGESFSATGLMIIDRAWLAVYAKYEVLYCAEH